MRKAILWLSLFWCACGRQPHPAPEPAPVVDLEWETTVIGAVLDSWHAAAAAADEARYFGHLTDDAIFLGTDATERWDKASFRRYAHPHFAKGKAWSFEAIRRDVVVDGDRAWFDEDLATPNLGPARGSGVLRKLNGRWRIAHYNLAITVPNSRFKSVKALLAGQPAPPPATHAGTVTGHVLLTGPAPLMGVPKLRKTAHFCRNNDRAHNAVRLGAPRSTEPHGRPLADVLVRLEFPKGAIPPPQPAAPVDLYTHDCEILPRMSAIVAGDPVHFGNADPTMHNFNVRQGPKVLLNTGMPSGATAARMPPADKGLVRVGCDVHPWERAFVFVSPHAYFAVTGLGGRFRIANVPAGHYKLHAWHSQWGAKWKEIIVDDHGEARLTFKYDGAEDPPPENANELDGLR